MKKAILLAAVAVSVLGASAQSVYTNYYHWEWTPVEVADTNAVNAVRLQMDFTKPIHGPWLLNPSPDSITVCFITRIACGAALDYREKGQEEFTRVWNTTYGMIDYSSDHHVFHLKGLKPATDYEYRLVTTMDAKRTYYSGIVTGREIYPFHTIDPDKRAYKVFVTSDFHGGSRLNLDYLVRNTNAEDADFHFFLGDNVEDSMNESRYYITFGFLDDVVRAWGATNTTVFLRGNHDSWGLENYRWRDYFPRTDGRAFFAFSQGPAMFIVFDTMAQGLGSPANREIMSQYINAQTNWFQSLKSTPEWKKARFHIAMGHYATHGGETTSFMAPFRAAMNDKNPANRVHMYLCGHEHAYARLDAGSTNSLVRAISPRWAFAPTNTYHEIICSLVEGMTIDVAPDKLVFRSHLWNKYPGTDLRDHFELYPDGRIKPLMEVASFPLPPPPQPKKK